MYPHLRPQLKYTNPHRTTRKGAHEEHTWCLRSLFDLTTAILGTFAWLAALVFTFSVATAAQESYRTYQELSGRVLNTGRGAVELKTTALPMRFHGWKYPALSAADYRKWFSRPRARSAYQAPLIAGRAATYAHAVRQFSGVELPGLLLRNSLPTGFIPTAVATGDFNSDGRSDFVVANGGDDNLWLYFGRGDGTFSLPIILPITMGESPVSLAAGDFRGNGTLDLVVGNADSNSVSVFLGNGDGSFVEQSIALSFSPQVLVVGDFNHDGKKDIVVSGFSSAAYQDYFEMLPGLGDGQFGSGPLGSPMSYPVSLAASDLNNDGYPDLVFTYQTTSIGVFLNDHSGSFEFKVNLSQYVVNDAFISAVGQDFDGDGKQDIIGADLYGLLWFYAGNGDGTFATPTTFGTGDIPFGLGTADVDGDGKLDVVTSGVYIEPFAPYGAVAGNLTSVLLGDGRGDFLPPKVYRGDLSAFSLAIADFNQDGHPDIVTANQDHDSAVVFVNDGNGGFGDPQGEWIGYNQGAANAPFSGMVSADIDGDGNADLAFIEVYPISSSFYQLAVLLNDGTGHFPEPVRSDAIDANLSPFFGDFVLADFRNTGKPDFLSIGSNPNGNGVPRVSFAPNVGGGQFGAPTSTALPTSLVYAQGVIGVGDFNRDGKLDFVTVTGGAGSPNNQALSMFPGNGDGTFRTGMQLMFGGSILRFPAAIYVGDFNRDGRLDLLIFLEDNQGWTSVDAVYEAFGNGDGTFQVPRVLFEDFDPMIVVDVNHDGHPDIVRSSFRFQSAQAPNPAKFTIYIGQADGSFSLANTYDSFAYPNIIPQYTYATSAAAHYAPLVADFNGDGNLDIGAFQLTSSPVNPAVFAQFLLGNGDGTFTPTYTSVDFQKFYFPNLAVDVTGDGRADLVELDGYRSSFHVIPAAVGPAFQFRLTNTPVVGSTGMGIITLALPGSGSTAISLSTSDAAINVPATVTVSGGEVSQTFAFTISPAFNANQVFAITAQMGNTSAVAYGTVIASGSAGFTATMSGPLSLPNINLGAGQAASNILVNLTSANGYSTNVSLQCLDLPVQAHCQFNPPSMALQSGGYATSGMSLSVAAGTPQGSYPAQLQVSDGVLTRTVPFTVNVGDFSLSLSPLVLHMFPTDNQGYNLVLGSINHFDQQVNLSCSGLPSGANCSVGYPTVNAGPNGPPQNGVAITTQFMSVGNYQLTVIGTSPPINHTTTATLRVWDFNTSLTPSKATVSPGGSADFTISINPVNSFNQSVTFQCNSSSSLITCAFSPDSPTVSATGTTTDTLTLTASSQISSSPLPPRTSSPPIWTVASVFLPFAALLLAVGDFRQKFVALPFLLLAVCLLPSCGGGSVSGGAGSGSGGEDPQSYSVDIIVHSGNQTKKAGTITLTVK